jgi:hypothetical protein
LLWKRILVVVYLLFAAASGARADSPFVFQPSPVLLGSDLGTLEALFVRPSAPGRYPLALLAHGSSRSPANRANMTPLAMLPHAPQFARRRWGQS